MGAIPNIVGQIHGKLAELHAEGKEVFFLALSPQALDQLDEAETLTEEDDYQYDMNGMLNPFTGKRMAVIGDEEDMYCYHLSWKTPDFSQGRDFQFDVTL